MKFVKCHIKENPWQGLSYIFKIWKIHDNIGEKKMFERQDQNIFILNDDFFSTFGAAF